MKIACPSCAKSLSVPEERIGAKTRCPACKHVFVVAQPEEEDVPEAEVFDDAATLPAPAASAMAAARASASPSTRSPETHEAKRLKAKLAEGKMFLGLAERNLAESRPDLLEVDLAREAYDLVLTLDPSQREATSGLARVAELRARTDLALQSLKRSASREEEEATETQVTSSAESTALAEPQEKSPAKKKKKGLWDTFTNFFTKYVCPKCNQRGGVETTQNIVEEYEQYRTTFQTDYHYSSDGYTQTGSTNREVQALYQVIVYDQYYRCDDCGHEWGERLSSANRL